VVRVPAVAAASVRTTLPIAAIRLARAVVVRVGIDIVIRVGIDIVIRIGIDIVILIGIGVAIRIGIGVAVIALVASAEHDRCRYRQQ